MGATAEQLAELAEQDIPEEDFEVLPVNWPAVQIFLDCAGQWLRDAKGTPTAISRPAVHSCLELWPVPRKQHSDTFHRIRVLEDIAAREFKRRAKSG